MRRELTAAVEGLEVPRRRKLEACGAEVEAALLERHETRGGEKARSATDEIGAFDEERLTTENTVHEFIKFHRCNKHSHRK